MANVRLTKTESSPLIIEAVLGRVDETMKPVVLRVVVIAALTSFLAACASVGGGGKAGGATHVPVVTDPAPIVSGTMRPYQIRGRWYRPADDPNYNEVGLASWYGDQFNGRPTATGERFDMHALTAAHKTLPLPGLVEVTNLANGRTVVLRVNDRGPFVDSRIIDLSRGAAEQLDMISKGVGQVRVRYLGPAPRGGGGGQLMRAQTTQPPVQSIRQPPVQMAAAPPPPPIIVPKPAPAPAPSQYWVQAGSFADPVAARLTAESLGDQASVNLADVGGSRLYRVLVGPWGDAGAAESARQSIMARGVRGALLISAQ